jgi:hypothetical protein
MMMVSNDLLGMRSIEAIAGSESLFTQPGGLSADALTAQLASLIPLDLLSAQGSPDEAQPAISASSQVADLINSVSSAALLTASEGSSQTVASPGALVEALGHSLTDLGHDTNQTLVADVTKLPGEVSGLNETTGNVADAINNLGSATIYAGQFVDDVTETVTGAGERPLIDTANELVLDFHQLLEGASHEIGLTYVTHAVTNLGETIGLGKIGTTDTLVTDVLNLPGTLLVGGDVVGAVTHVTDHVGDLANGVAGLITAIPQDLGSDPSGLGLLGSDGIIGGSGLDLDQVGDLLSPGGGGALGVVGGLVDNLTTTLDLVGSNSDGSDNLVTDVLKLPGELLSGNGTPSLTDAGHQLDVTLTATGDLVANILGTTEGGLSNSPNGLTGSVSQALDTFGDTGGTAIGIPLAIDGLVSTTQALGLGGGTADAGGLLAGISQTVEGALADLANDAASAGLGSAIAIPSLDGAGTDGLAGLLTPTADGGGGLLATVTNVIEADGSDGGVIGTVTSLLDLDNHGQSGGGLGHALGLI